MAEDRAELIRLLEAELDFIEGGGYGKSAGKPTEEKPLFKGSLACINHWLVPGHESECHDDCVLLDWVPEGARKAELPCHLIPLNAAGETVKSIEAAGERDRLEAEVKQWLAATIERLKNEPGTTDHSEVKY